MDNFRHDENQMDEIGELECGRVETGISLIAVLGFSQIIMILVPVSETSQISNFVCICDHDCDCACDFDWACFDDCFANFIPLFFFFRVALSALTRKKKKQS